MDLFFFQVYKSHKLFSQIHSKPKLKMDIAESQMSPRGHDKGEESIKRSKRMKKIKLENNDENDDYQKDYDETLCNLSLDETIQKLKDDLPSIMHDMIEALLQTEQTDETEKERRRAQRELEKWQAKMCVKFLAMDCFDFFHVLRPKFVSCATLDEATPENRLKLYKQLIHMQHQFNSILFDCHKTHLDQQFPDQSEWLDFTGL